LCKHKSITPQTGRRIKNHRPDTRLDANCLGNHLTATAPLLTTVCQRPFNEIDTHRPRRPRSELLQLQSARPYLQSKFAFTDVRQSKFVRQEASRLGKLRPHRFDANNCLGVSSHGFAE
jgi:hypothetical protein